MWSEKAALVPQQDALVEGVRTPHSPLGTNKVCFRSLQDKTHLRLDSLLFDSANRPSILILRFYHRLPRLARRLQPCRPRGWEWRRPYRRSLVLSTWLRMTEQPKFLSHPRDRILSMLRVRRQSLRRLGHHGHGMMADLCPRCTDDPRPR
jgi:hypothetical protein